MYWKRKPIIDERILLDVLNQYTNNIYSYDILKKCQSITNSNYCNYIHKNGKNKGLICGTISKNKNGKCYTHSRNKKSKKIKIEINIDLIIIFSILYNSKKYISYDPYKNYNMQFIEFFKIKKYLFIFTKEIYNIVINLLYEYNTKNNVGFPHNKNVDKNQQLKLKNKKKKNKKKIKKIIKLNNNIKLNKLKDNIEITLNLFNEKVPKNELTYTLHLLFKENIKLLKIYVNIILSNINYFFNNVEMEILLKIWNNDIEYIQYKNVLIFNDTNHNDIIEKIFYYVKGNYNLIPDYIKILWIDYYNNSIIPYDKKYNIECCNVGINIYDKKDYKKQNPLPTNKITILYY